MAVPVMVWCPAEGALENVSTLRPNEYLSLAPTSLLNSPSPLVLQGHPPQDIIMFLAVLLIPDKFDHCFPVTLSSSMEGVMHCHRHSPPLMLIAAHSLVKDIPSYLEELIKAITVFVKEPAE